jgi:hypothetical protein
MEVEEEKLKTPFDSALEKKFLKKPFAFMNKNSCNIK